MHLPTRLGFLGLSKFSIVLLQPQAARAVTRHTLVYNYNDMLLLGPART